MHSPFFFLDIQALSTILHYFLLPSTAFIAQCCLVTKQWQDRDSPRGFDGGTCNSLPHPSVCLPIQQTPADLYLSKFAVRILSSNAF
ncbi:hypothetical protein BDW71DRAFT_127344 [Aspergillus fruticulosus]